MTPVTTFPLVDAILAGRDRNLDGVILIAAQHLLQTTHAMLRSLFRVGLDPRNVAVIGKCYSTHPGVVDAMRADGIYVDDCSDAYAPHESFDTQYTRHVERFFAESWARLTAGRTARVVLLDDGGSLLAVAGAMLDASADVIGIEQTSAGYAKIVGCALGFPVINIARSSAKLLYESPIIAARVTQTAFERTAGIDSSAAILITGAGAIGTALADVLRPLHDRVDVYDTRSGCMTPIDLPNAIGGADHFFVIESGELEALVDGKVILRLGAGDHFGEACLLGGMRRIATVRACEPSVLWELDGKAFGDALHRDAAMREIAYGVARTRLMHAGASESLMV